MFTGILSCRLRSQRTESTIIETRQKPDQNIASEIKANNIHTEEITLSSNNETTFNEAIRHMLKHSLKIYLNDVLAPIEVHSAKSARILLENTDWRLVQDNEKVIFDVAWFKYGRRDMNNKSKLFLSAHKDHYDLDSVLRKDLHTPLLQVIAKQILYKLADKESFPSEQEKNDYLKEMMKIIAHNNFDGIIRMLINKFLEYGNEILSPSDIEVINKSSSGHTPLFNFMVLKGQQEPYREVLVLLNHPDHIYHIEEKNLLRSYQGFISTLVDSNKFQVIETQKSISPSLVAIVHVYEKISHEFNNLMKNAKILQRSDNAYVKLSDVNSEIIKKLFKLVFLKKLKGIMIFNLIKCMQKTREL